MDEYIEREAAIRALALHDCDSARAKMAICDLPAADVAQVRNGQWEGYSHSRYCGIDDFGDPIYKDGVVYYCSECRRKTVIKERYCPSCGAKMDGGYDG